MRKFDNYIDEDSVSFITGQMKVRYEKKDKGSVRLADSEEGITQAHAKSIVDKVVNKKK